MKIFNKIIGLIFGIILFPFLAFAGSATISTETKKIDANSNFNINLKMSWETWSFDISNFIWLDNFDIVWERQSSFVKTINWKSVSELTLVLTLSPRKSWKFKIWPVWISDWISNFQTNFINIEITWNKFFVSQPRPSNFNKKIKKQKNNNKVQKPKKIEKIEDFEKNIIKKDFSNKYEKYFLVFVILLWLIFVYAKIEERGDE